MNKWLIIILTPLALQGCSTYSSHFKCPAGEGNACHSISQNVEKIEHGDSGTSTKAQKPVFYIREGF